MGVAALSVDTNIGERDPELSRHGRESRGWMAGGAGYVAREATTHGDAMAAPRDGPQGGGRIEWERRSGLETKGAGMNEYGLLRAATGLGIANQERRANHGSAWQAGRPSACAMLCDLGMFGRDAVTGSACALGSFCLSGRRCPILVGCPAPGGHTDHGHRPQKVNMVVSEPASIRGSGSAPGEVG